jgi:predicted  nucleic acid-binding Zn-ribbon protein
VRKTTLAFLIAVATAILLITITSNITIVKAANGEDYSITYVSHKIDIMSNGYILINDTVQLSGQATNGFLIGFPYKYGSRIIQCLAYNSTGTFPVTLNASLDNRVGFYGVNVSFPLWTPETFTIGFVLSNSLLTQDSTNTSRYTLDFPAYPSFTKTVTTCNVSIAETLSAQYISGTVSGLVYQKENLTAFTYMPSNVTFLSTSGNIQIIDVKELKREITITEGGQIDGSDSYYITNNGPKETSSVEVTLPPNASNPTAQDQFGRSLSGSSFSNQAKGLYKVSFTLPVESGKSERFTVNYELSSKAYINAQKGKSSLDSNSLLFKNINYYVEQASLSIVLPEGARVSSFGNYSISQNVFYEALAMNRDNISILDNSLPREESELVIYDYNPLWLSFRPTLWMLAITIFGCAVVLVWKRPKAPAPLAVPTAAVSLQHEHIRAFIDAYEEKRKIMREIESLEVRAEKGRIPRRRYKVQRTTLETRLNALSRNLMSVKERMRAAGGHYVELMRQLEIAETDITEAEANIKSIEARHERGEISMETHRRLLADYERRKERANTAIDGIIIRLREEIR